MPSTWRRLTIIVGIAGVGTHPARAEVDDLRMLDIDARQNVSAPASSQVAQRSNATPEAVPQVRRPDPAPAPGRPAPPAAADKGAPISPAVIPSTLTGLQLSIERVLTVSYNAGFKTEEALLAAVGLAIAESGLWTAARHWKPYEGFRPATDLIAVIGPPEVWSADNRRQMHSDRGLWQLSSRWWGRYADPVADDPGEAAKAAFFVSRNGTDFAPWDSYVSGEAQKHYDEPYDGWPALRPIVREFLAKLPARR